MVLVTHEYAPFRGGAATYVEELANALRHEAPDLHVHVLTLGANDPNDKPSAVPIERLGGSPNLRLRNRLRLIRALHRRRGRQETWILASYGALFALMLLKALAPGRFPPYLIILHGSELLKFERHFLLRVLSRKTFADAVGVAATSHHVCERMLCSYLGPSIQHGFVLPCGPPAWLAQTLPRSESPVPGPSQGSKVRILTLARLHPRKGQLDTALALARLPAHLKSRLVWILAGTGAPSYLETILAVCREGGIAVDVRGEVSAGQMPETYKECDFYVMSSRSLPDSLEGFGLTYLEAAWFGKPCIGYRTGGVAEAVRHEETGVLVEEGNVEKLSEAIGALLADASLRRRLGLAAAQHARRFDWNHTADVLLAFRERLEHAR
jgi:phosphatidylinositol alpha-1,6-mannosyltransferase